MQGEPGLPRGVWSGTSRQKIVCREPRPLLVRRCLLLQVGWQGPRSPPKREGEGICMSLLGLPYDKTRQLKEQKFILSQCWGLQVQDQGVSRVGSSRGL